VTLGGGYQGCCDKYPRYAFDLLWAATVAMSGIIFFGAPAGRPGEWERMLLEDMRTVIANGKDFIACSDHKTAKWYVDLGKYLPPGQGST